VTETTAFAGLIGAIAWNLITLAGLPSISSHALIGGVATCLAAAFGHGALGPLLIGVVAIGGPLSMTLATRRRRAPKPAHPVSA
jgi:hypothetical protein